MTNDDPLDPGAGPIDDDQTDDQDGSGRAERIGETVGAIPMVVLGGLLSFLGGIAGGVLGKIPKRTSVYRKMIKLGYQGMYKKTSAHVVANTIYRDGELVPRPAQLDTDTSDLETNNGEEWTTTGLQPTRVGDVPVVTGVADHHELVDHVAARTAEAVDYSDKRYQTVQNTPQGTMPVETGAQAGQRVADGGETLLERSTTFSDIWVDASNPDESNDGWIISMQKAYDLHWDQAASEEMENQETRGILAAKDPRQDKKRMIIIAAMILGAFALGMFGPALAAQLAGGASGAAPGGGISLSLGLL